MYLINYIYIYLQWGWIVGYKQQSDDSDDSSHPGGFHGFYPSVIPGATN